VSVKMLHVCDVCGEEIGKRIMCEVFAKNLGAVERFDVCFPCMKSFTLDSALDAVLKRRGEGTK